MYPRYYICSSSSRCVCEITYSLPVFANLWQVTEESVPVISHGVATITRTTSVQEYFATKFTHCPARSAVGGGCSQDDVSGHGQGTSGCGQEKRNGYSDATSDHIEKPKNKKRKKVRTKRDNSCR